DAVELLLEHAEQLVDTFGRGAGVDPEGAGLLVRRAVRVDGVREAAPLPHLLEQARRHPAAQHLVEHAERIAVGILTWQRAHAEHEVHLLEVLLYRTPRPSGALP